MSLEKQIESKGAREVMLSKLALLNANSETKNILCSFPLEPEPTID